MKRNRQYYVLNLGNNVHKIRELLKVLSVNKYEFRVIDVLFTTSNIKKYPPDEHFSLVEGDIVRDVNDKNLKVLVNKLVIEEI